MRQFTNFIKILLLAMLLAAITGLYNLCAENNRLLDALDGQAYEAGYSDGYKTGRAISAEN